MSNKRKRTGSATAIEFSIDLSEIDGMIQVLKELPTGMRNQIAKPIVTKIVQAGSRTARINLARMLPHRDPKTRMWDRPTGALRDSIGSKVVPLSKMRDKLKVYGLYGARTDFKVTKQTARRIAGIRKTSTRILRIGMTGRGEIAGPLPIGKHLIAGRMKAAPGAIQPSKYIHLVELGHKAVPAWRIPAARPYPFMAATRRAMNAIAPIIMRDVYNSAHARVFQSYFRRYMRRAGQPVAGRA